MHKTKYKVGGPLSSPFYIIAVSEIKSEQGNIAGEWQSHDLTQTSGAISFFCSRHLVSFLSSPSLWATILVTVGEGSFPGVRQSSLRKGCATGGAL